MLRSAAMLAASGLAIVAPGAFAQTASFRGVGHVSGGDPFSVGYRASEDGAALVGIGREGGVDVAFRWTGMDMLVSLGRLDAGGESQAFAVSAEGRVIAGTASVPGGKNAFRWTAIEGMTSLSDLGGPAVYSAAYACSRDAAVIAGIADADIAPGEEFGRAQAFRWTTGTGMSGLGFLHPGDAFSDAEAMTPDGATIIGASGLEGVRLEAVRWFGGAIAGLGDLPGGRLNSFAYGCNPDASVIVGQGESAAGPEAFRWTSAGMAGIGDLPGGDFASAAIACNADGTIIVGFGATEAHDREAFIWTPSGGMRRLIDVLQVDHHLALDGWVLRHAGSISADGRFIAGDGYNPKGEREAWIVDMAPPSSPPSCEADFNRDGVVNSQDFFDFLTSFFTCM